jgi:thiol-disulfide isomerase/thioredoxin
MFGEELQGNVSTNNNNLKGTPGNVVGVSQNVGTPLELVVSTDPNKMQVDSLTTSLAELQSPSNNAVQMKPNNNNNNNNMYSLENNLNSNVISNNGNNSFNNLMNNGNISMPVPTNSIGASASGMVDQAAPVSNNNNNNNNRVNNNNNNNNRVNNNNNNNNGNNNKNGKKFRITLVHAKWCGFCKKAKPEWDKLVAENPFPNVELRDIEDTNKEELAKYKGKVKGFPTFIVEDMSTGSPVYVNQFNAIDKEKMISKINENIN